MSFKDLPISLAAGVMHETTDPVLSTKAAIAAGWDGIGYWIDLAEWTPDTTREVLSLTRDSGLEILDVEVLLLRPGAFDESMLRAVDIGLAIGSKNYIIASYDSDLSAVADKMKRLCEHAGHEMDITLEFIPHTGVKTIDDAMTVVKQVGLWNATVMIDPLHMRTAGMGPDDIVRADPGRVTYVQFCDIGPLRIPIPPLNMQWDQETALALRKEAWDERLLPGDGVLPLERFLDALPRPVPLSIELRSRFLREHYPDPFERAQVLADATRQYLKRVDERKAAR